MRFLIAGLGSIGRRHLRNLIALGERDIFLLRSFRSTLADDVTLADGRKLSEIPVETDLHAALSRQPEAVIVANPTALHLDVAIPAARAGCYLLVEKPISHSREGLDELGEALGQGGGRLLVGYQFRFHPGLLKIKALLAEKAIGEVVSARTHWGEYLPGWHPWEDYRQGYAARKDLGGGVVLTLSHALDYLRWLVGEGESVFCYTGQGSLEVDVDACAEIALRFRSGATGAAHLDYLQRPPSHTLEITGREGLIRWDNATGEARVFRASPGEWDSYPAPPGFERNHLFLDELRHFIQVARGEAEPVCSFDDGRKSLELALAALKSAESGQAVRLHG